MTGPRRGFLAAFWPVLDASTPLDQLLERAHRALPGVALRARARVTGEPTFSVLPGREVPGARGHALVVYCRVPAEALPDHQRAARSALAAAQEDQ